MTADPKKDEFKGSEIADERLENVAGGIRDRRVGKDLTGSELNDKDLEEVAGGKGTLPSRKEKIAEEAPD